MAVFLVSWVASRCGVAIIDSVSRAISHAYEPLPQTLHTNAAIDFACLAINSVVETAFTLYTLQWASALPDGGLATPLRVALLFVGDDLLYAPYHYALHSRLLYPLIHRRHHLVSQPYAGYVHASLEHPLEMSGALLLHTALLRVLRPLLDAPAVVAHIALKALVACLNHSGRNVDIGVYSSRHHHVHHNRRTVNFAQHVFLFDRCMGTFAAA
jgi:sterol desaturase/sphingolipid hydroxylase (fatty acid hydroxylase superfamily)